jgi:hypothetical protein
MRKISLILISLLFALTTFADSNRGIGVSDQSNRFALVIGNANYQSAPLKNPVNDTNDIASLLKQNLNIITSSSGINSLKKFIIWIYGANQGFCKLFEDKGFQIRCSEGKLLKYGKNEIILICNALPRGAGRVIRNFIKRPNYKIYDYRYNPKFGDCTKHDISITVKD